MSNINLEHIKLFRQYLLSHNEEIRSNLRNSLPGIVQRYLSVIERDFVSNTEIESTASSIGATHLLSDLRKLQYEYYASLSRMYAEGKSNREIELLLESKNILFKEAVEAYQNQIFESEIKKAFILIERESLKKRFSELDEQEELSPAEIQAAFKQIERVNLKEKFNELDQDETAVTASVNMATSASRSSTGKVVKFNWKTFAIAASVIGFIALASLFIFIGNTGKMSSPDVAAEKSKYKTIPPDTNKLQINPSDSIDALLDDKSLAYTETQAKVYHEQSFGFGEEKEEKLVIRIYNLQERIAILEKAYKNRTSDKGQTGNEHSVLSLKRQIDSLTSLEGKFNFKKGVLSLYSKENIKSQVFKIKKGYFLKMGSSVYYLRETDKPSDLKKLTDEKLLTEIDKIEFQQTN